MLGYPFPHCQGESCDRSPRSSSMPWWRSLRPLVLPWFLVAASSCCRSNDSNRDWCGAREMPSLAPARFQEQVGGRWCQSYASMNVESCYRPPWGIMVASFSMNGIVFLFHSAVRSRWKWLQAFESGSSFEIHGKNVTYVILDLWNSSKIAVLELKAPVKPY